MTPEAKGRLLVDLINEPDGYDLTWDVSKQELPSGHLHDPAWMCCSSQLMQISGLQQQR